MSAVCVIFVVLSILAITALVRCWWKPDPNYIGWLMLAFFSLIGSIAAQ